MTTLLRTTRTRIVAAAAAVAIASPLVFAGPAFAGVQMQNPVEGISFCNPEGLHDVTWTLTNTTNYTVDIDSASFTGNASGDVELSPNPVPQGESATGESILPGELAGPVVITVETSWVEVEIPMSTVSTYTVNFIACPGSTTTTTSTTSTSTTSTTAPSTTTTTAPPAAVVAVVATPRFTG